jgi:ribonuclease HI
MVADEISKRIGEATNNVAEYTAVREALAYLRNYLPRSGIPLRGTIIQFYLDSNLVVQQLNGMFKVKDAKLRELMMQVKILESEIGGMISYQYIPREENQRADFLVNKALDNP